jgi:hypothetical protein
MSRFKRLVIVFLGIVIHGSVSAATPCTTDFDCAVKSRWVCCGAEPSCYHVKDEPLDNECLPGAKYAPCWHPMIYGCRCQDGVCMEGMGKIMDGIPDNCSRIRDQFTQLLCYHYNAQKLRDPDLCLKLPSTQQQQQDCVVQIAQKDILYCEKAPAPSGCYDQIFSNERLVGERSELTLEDCHRIAALDERADIASRCYRIHSKQRDFSDVGACSSLDNMRYRDWCVHRVGMRKGMEQICATVQNARWKDRCLESVASRSWDLRICGMIADTELRTNCVRSAGEKGGNPEVCAQALEEAELKDVCYFSAAKASLNPAYCRRCSTQNKRDECFSMMATTLAGKGSMSVNSSDYSSKWSILLQMGLKQKEGIFCKEIVDAEHKSDCYYLFALRFKNRRLCELIEVDKVKTKCIEALKPWWHFW